MKPIHILLVEDNDGDILLTQEAFEEAKIKIRLSVVKDGSDAIAFLSGQHEVVELPDMILLDVNLPKINGHEVLKYIKKTDGIKRIPVIMLTTSSSPADINNSYDNYVNSYITKPIEVNNFFRVINTIKDFWFTTVRLPIK
jgi:CheY-like chemotaxis protein